jgi:hypothetical protein
MNWFKGIGVALLTGTIFQLAEAGEGTRFWQLQNRIRVEYDDNVRQTSSDEDDSLKIIEQVEFQANFDLENTFIGFSYAPSFTYWDDRDEDDTDVHHYLNLSLNHEFSPRVRVSLKDTYLRAEQPELIERGSTFREENDYDQNDLNADLILVLKPGTRLTASGRYLFLGYDDDDVSAREDYDLYVAGLTLSHQMKPSTDVRGELRYEMIGYDEADDRDSDTVSFGVGADQTFTPNLLGSARAGYSVKNFDDAATDDTDSPYADVSLTLMPSPATRITAGAGYSLYEAGVSPYVNQERLQLFVGAAHDLTARIGLFLSLTYTDGDYDGEEVAGDTPSVDGSEDSLLVSARANYQVNRSNSLELSYHYTDFSSDLAGRLDYDRNRISVGWRVRL